MTATCLSSDPSMKAYGAMVYISYHDQITLVMSKSRVAPTKTITLPKLELMAAVMATRLANFVTSSLYNYVPPVCYYPLMDRQSDSKSQAQNHLYTYEPLRLSAPFHLLSGHLLRHQIILQTSS